VPSGVQQYRVVVEREGAARAVAKTRGHTLILNAEKGKGEAGFNAAETLMASLGACLMTNCVKWGTVTNTLMSGVQPTGTLRVQRPEN